MTKPETKKRKRRGSQVVFRRKRANGTHYDGSWIRVTDAFGDRHLGWGGETKEAAGELHRPAFTKALTLSTTS